jgi:hypothetical protein
MHRMSPGKKLTGIEKSKEIFSRKDAKSPRIIHNYLSFKYFAALATLHVSL